MFKCNQCGEVFEEGKEIRESHGFTDGTFETLHVCPCCGGEYSPAVQCDKCGEWGFEDEIFSGFCADCLWDEVDYVTAYDYLKTIDEALSIFVFEKCLDSTVPEKKSEKFDVLVSKLYWEAVAADREAEGGQLLVKLKAYIVDEEDQFGKEDFAEWLSRREV